MNINGTTRAAINANAVKGFAEFVEKISTYPVNVETTVANVLGSDIWSNEIKERSDKISLGKAIKSNVDCGNLKGIIPVETAEGQNQKYKRIGQVEMSTVFSCDYWGSAETIQKLLSLNQQLTTFAFIQCSFSTDVENNKLNLKCKIMDNKGTTICEEKPFEKDLTFFVKHHIDLANYEFKAILSIWYGFDRAFEKRELLLQKGFNSICFLAPNDQMMRRVAGLKFNTSASAYEYTDFIQQNFFQFKKGEIRELPFRYGIISLLNTNLK